MYEHFIGDLMGDVRIFPAVIFYVIYVIGVTFFVLIPGTEKGSIGYVILAGALFGLICYATYDLTNLATLKDWPVAMTVIDLVWGTAVTTVTSVIVYFINMNFFGGGS
ncbi:integral membrane protein, partial [Listeria seeligeri FSL S4-171]